MYHLSVIGFGKNKYILKQDVIAVSLIQQLLFRFWYTVP